MLEKNHVTVRFCIWGFEDISHDEISKDLGVTPIKQYYKGQRNNSNYSGLAKENGWLYEPKTLPDETFDEQMSSLLNFIENNEETLIAFSNKYFCEISCAVFIYCDIEESTPSIHLDAKYNQVVKKLNLDFDVDLYCLQSKDKK